MFQKFMWRLAIVLILAVFLWLISPLPATAQGVEEYFQLSYDPVSFSKNEIQGSEVFNITIGGRATCTNDLPMPVGEASITSRVVAKHTVSGTEVTLNPSYTVTIKPFPAKKDEIAEINQAVPLQFPAQAEPGDYKVVGKIVEAKVKVTFAWVPVTEFLPQEQQMGTVKYTASESTAAPAPKPTPKVTPEPTPTPAPTPALTPTPTPTPAPAPTTSPPEYYGIVWWVWLIVAVAGATTAFNIVWFLWHRNI